MKPRTSITWEPRNLDVLRRFSAASGESITSIVNEIVAAFAPDMTRVIELAERMQSASEEVRQHMTTVAEQSASTVMPQAQEAYRAYQTMLANLDELASAGTGNEKQPPYSNTGVIK